jgi:hypothetical protein
LRIRFTTVLSIRFKAACSALVVGGRGLAFGFAFIGAWGLGGGDFVMADLNPVLALELAQQIAPITTNRGPD